MKKYNSFTKGYKIDVFYDGKYVWSTDMFKRCKDAKENFLWIKHNNNSYDPKLVKCYFGQ